MGYLVSIRRVLALGFLRIAVRSRRPSAKRPTSETMGAYVPVSFLHRSESVFAEWIDWLGMLITMASTRNDGTKDSPDSRQPKRTNPIAAIVLQR